MQHSIKASGQDVEIILSGRLTFADAPGFPTFLSALDKAAKTRWNFDLAQLEFIDSTGMSLFVHVYDAAAAMDVKVSILNSCGNVSETLKRAAFHTLFDFK